MLKQYGPLMFRREAATTLRGRKYGPANQLEHEQEGRRKRKAMQDKLAAQRAERISGAAKKKHKETGMNAGTLGKSRL